jgi:hypothetical protein
VAIQVSDPIRMLGAKPHTAAHSRQYAHGQMLKIVRRSGRAIGRTLWSAHPSTVVPLSDGVERARVA